MRIIGGKYKGFRFNPPPKINARPTTDRAKESLINILNSSIGIEKKICLDLFCGTGNISFEFASHGAEFVTAVDLNFSSIDFVKNTFEKLGFSNFDTIKKDVFKWLSQNHKMKYDIVFADPPYDILQLDKLPELIIESDMVNNSTTLIIEHRSNFNFKHPMLINQRKYGQSAFSFFKC